MGVFIRVMKGTLKTVVDVPSWLGMRALKDHTRILYDGVKPMVVPRKTRETLAFKEAMARYGITTEAELQSLLRSYFLYAMIFLVVGFLVMAYSVYWFLSGSFVVGIITLLLSVLVFVRAYGFHFWYFEIKHQKLGCTFREWLKGRVEGGSQ